MASCLSFTLSNAADKLATNLKLEEGSGATISFVSKSKALAFFSSLI